MPKSIPIQIYLDNSDFSRLASSGGSSEKDLLRQLRSLVERKKIQIRYSGITLLESAHNYQDNRDDAIARARVIEELCRGHTFPIFTDLQRIEIDNYLNGKITTEKSIHREHNQWLFKPEELTRSLINQIESSLYEALGASSRQDRRRIRKDLSKNGTLRRQYKTIIENSGNSISSTVLKTYPVLQYYPITKDIQDRLTGKTSEETFSNNLSNGLFSPIPFTEYLYDMYRRKPGSQKDIIRSFGARLIDLVEIFRHEISNIFELGESLGKSEKQIKQKVKSLSDDWLDRRNRILVDIYSSELAGESHTSEDEIRSKVRSIPLGKLPSFDLMLQLSWQFAYQKALDQRSGLSSSDGGDILHANYLPYTDVFRADKRMRPLLRSICMEHSLSTKIADSIEDVIAIVKNWGYVKTTDN